MRRPFSTIGKLVQGYPKRKKQIWITGFVVILATFLFFAGRYSDAGKLSNRFFSIFNNKEVNVISMDGQDLIIEDLVEGEGVAIEKGQVAVVHYTGKFESGEEFDSSLKAGRSPFQFVVGAGQVISGWDEGVVGMKVGGKRKLVIPPELGYGPEDYGPIPGGSTLIFEVELLSIFDR